MKCIRCLLISGADFWQLYAEISAAFALLSLKHKAHVQYRFVENSASDTVVPSSDNA